MEHSNIIRLMKIRDITDRLASLEVLLQKKMSEGEDTSEVSSSIEHLRSLLEQELNQTSYASEQEANN